MSTVVGANWCGPDGLVAGVGGGPQFPFPQKDPARRILVEPGWGGRVAPGMTKSDPFNGYHSSPEIIRLAVMLHVRLALSLRDVEDRLHWRGIDITYETIRYWWYRLLPSASC